MHRYVTHKSIACFVVFITTAFVSIGVFSVIQRVPRHTCVGLVHVAPREPAVKVDSEPAAQREEPQQLFDIFG
ncbi:MAG TPA: hypothetical protein VFY61_02705, partial [Pyrinomonadaceae bacterium]|nr:hypothetical protein [Pyrinomonadaceae bacterium]